MRWTPAFKVHGPASVGLTRIPGDIVKFTFTTDDGRLGLHGKRSRTKKDLFFCNASECGRSSLFFLLIDV